MVDPLLTLLSAWGYNPEDAIDYEQQYPHSETGLAVRRARVAVEVLQPENQNGS